MAKLRSKGHDHDDDNEERDMSERSGSHDTEMPDADGPIWVNKFSEEAARAFTKQLQYQSKRDPNAPIVVYIDSPGGDVYALLTMLSAIDSVPNKIVTVALGKAMSAGAMLLAYGDLRYASPHASLMIHEISAGTVGHIDDINVQHKNIADLNEYIMKLFAKSCKIKGGYASLKKTLAKVRDLYLSPREAVKFGLVDRIGVPMLVRGIGVEYILTSDPRGKYANAKEAED
jgi:ATP-dependent Clp protease protease subunit